MELWFAQLHPAVQVILILAVTACIAGIVYWAKQLSDTI